MVRVFKGLLVLVLLLPFIAGALPLLALYLGLQDAPHVQPAASARQNDIARLKSILREHDPRDLGSTEVRHVQMTQRDLNIGLAAVNPLQQRQTARVVLAPGLAMIHYSLRLPANPIGEYFNASILVSENEGQLALDSLQLGDTVVAGWWLAPAILLIDGQLQARVAEYRDARAALRSVSIDEGSADFVYSMDAGLFSRIEARGRSLLLPEADQRRVRAYYGEIARVSSHTPSPASLTGLLQPLFTLAASRSESGEAAAENRALLLTLGLVMKGSSVRWLLGEQQASAMQAPQPVRWTLYGRDDLAQHFGVSAALSVGGGAGLADAIGAFKELDDSRGGTGFSFVDLLADRAGVEFANLSVAENASFVQQFLATPDLSESDIVPDINRLPEGLMEMTFRHRYQDLDDARYARIKRQVDVRVESLSLYRAAGGR